MSPRPGLRTGGRRPLSVRSALLSLMLGAHPDVVVSHQLLAAGRELEMSASSIRVALTRAVSAGDLHRSADGYALGDRLLARHRRQLEAIQPSQTSWSGAWESVAVVVTGRSGVERAALRVTLTAHRLAELRDGLWLRPANLARTPSYTERDDIIAFESRHNEPRELVARLWDLNAWTETAYRVLAQLQAATAPISRLTDAAELVHHLSTDPILPPELEPDDWPPDLLRAAYAGYQRELRALADILG